MRVNVKQAEMITEIIIKAILTYRLYAGLEHNLSAGDINRLAGAIRRFIAGVEQ